MAQGRRPINYSQPGMSIGKLTAIGILAAVAAGAFYLGASKDGGGGAASDSAYVLPIPAHGPDDAPVILAKWTDFQWPYCTKVGPTLKQLEEVYGEKLRVEYHHYPLSFHAYAESSAVASMAAHRQGKFFEMVDMLFSDTKKQDTASIEKYAAEIGLDVDQFKKDMTDKDLLRYVRMDAKAGGKLGVQGTPSMFLNGRKLNARDLDAFKVEIDGELAAVEKLTAAGDSVVLARKKRILDTANGVNYVEFVMERKAIEVDTAALKPPPPPKPKPKPVDKTIYNAVVNPGDPVKGPLDALVTIVECSDFQWPYCSRVGPTLKQIRSTYPNDVRIVFKHRPLSFHNRATPAAIASMAANNQGKFWPYHDKIFEEKKLEDVDLARYAEELGLDMDKFRADIQSKALADLVKKHDQQCVKIGASGTPAFFVNGRSLSGAKPFEEFKLVIDEELAKAKKLVAGGVARDKIYAAVMKNAGKKSGGGGSQLGPRQFSFSLDKSPSMGPVGAAATLVVFSDFQWPYCARLVEPAHEAVKKMKGRLRVVFKHFPLSFHANARNAAVASMAAHRQGKFWDYHDLLFQNMKRLGRKDLVNWAKVVGLDNTRFEKDLADPNLRRLIRLDESEGSRAGVRGTPSVYLNGRRVQNTPTSTDAIIALVNSEIFGQN